MFKVRVCCLLALVLACPAVADDKDKKEPDKRGGTVVGVVVKKEKNGIEVKADGEEKARRYVPHWRGGAPSAGGGLDKKMLEQIDKVKIGSRVKLEWVFEERPRVVKLEVLKAPPSEDKKDN